MTDNVSIRVTDPVCDYMGWPRNLILSGTIVYANDDRSPDRYDEFHWVDDDDQHFLWREGSADVQWFTLSPLEQLAEIAE